VAGGTRLPAIVSRSAPGLCCRLRNLHPKHAAVLRRAEAPQMLIGRHP
jgi:hypothetical protein